MPTTLDQALARCRANAALAVPNRGLFGTANQYPARCRCGRPVGRGEGVLIREGYRYVVRCMPCRNRQERTQA